MVKVIPTEAYKLHQGDHGRVYCRIKTQHSCKDGNNNKVFVISTE